MAAEWRARISQATVWIIQQCPAAINKHLPKAALAATAASLIGAYFRSPLWLAGAALSSYVTYKATPFQQLIALKSDMVDNFSGPKKENLQKSYRQKLAKLCSAHREELKKNAALINKMLAFLDGKCRSVDLHTFPIVKPSLLDTLSFLFKPAKEAAKPKPNVVIKSTIKPPTLEVRASVLFFRFVNELDTSRNARDIESFIQELENLIKQEDKTLFQKLQALTEILDKRPKLDLITTITPVNCSYLACKLRNEMKQLTEEYRHTKTVDQSRLDRLIKKCTHLHKSYQLLKARKQSIAYQEQYQIAMRYNRGVINLLKQSPELGRDQDDLPN